MYLCVPYDGAQQDKKCTCNRNIGARSRNRCCRGTAISITYSECTSISLFIQHAKRLRRIFSCGLPGCTIFSHITIIS